MPMKQQGVKNEIEDCFEKLRVQLLGYEIQEIGITKIHRELHHPCAFVFFFFHPSN